MFCIDTGLAGVDRWAVSQNGMAMDMRAGMIPPDDIYDMSRDRYA
jgi:hypothetical protein